MLAKFVSFSAALSTLDSQFKRPTRVLYALHQLLSSKQRPVESVLEFIKRLNILVEKYEYKALTITEHKESLFRDALITGLHCDNIRARHSELIDIEALFSDCLIYRLL